MKIKNKKDLNQTILFAVIFAITTFIGLMPIISAQQTNSCPMTGVGGMMYGGYGSGFLILSWITYIERNKHIDKNYYYLI